ncbi:MAG: hypothetical protein K0U12_07870 [Gammaproteobacteria bacterium]|nr:hypothetical protein [Gammaproteobacteria bacterium]
MKLKPIIYSVVVIVVAALSASCATKTYRGAAHDINQTRKNIDARRRLASRTPPAVVIKPGYYVNTKPMSLQRPPSWLSRPVSLQAEQLPFSLLIQRLLRNSAITVAYDNPAIPNQLISINFTGTVRQALDSLAARSHYAYRLQGKHLTWSSFVTRTFNIAFMPGESDYLVGQAQDTNNNSNQVQSYGSGGNVNHLQDDQYSSLRGSISVWRDLHRALFSLKSQTGKIIVSESTSTVTVHDHPGNVDAMAAYIHKLNKELSKEVGIKVQVLEVNLNDSENSGINWGAVANVLNTSIKFTSGFGTAANLTQSVVRGASATNGANFIIGRPNGTQTLMQALSTQGKVRSITRPQVVTMNDQIASIRITQDTGYIQSVSTSFFGSNGNASTSITPGNVTEGFTLYILPKVQDNRVMMQVTSSLSNLLRLDKENTCPNSGCTTSGSSNQQYNAIEVPTTSEKLFNQRSIVQSGHTLIIAGYKNLRDEIKDTGVFGVSALGGKGVTRKNVETVVLITPTILKTTG